MFSAQVRLSGLVLLAVVVAAPAAGPSATYRVRHSVEVKDLPEGAKKVRVWFWVPDDDGDQKVLDLKLLDDSARAKLTRDPGNGSRYLYAEVESPDKPVRIASEFVVRRDACAVEIDPAKAGDLTDSHRRLYAEYLRRDVPHMEVTPEIARLADEVCKDEKNLVRQARLLYDYLVANTHHYSKPDAPKSSGVGSAEYCLAKKGGGCTDQHAAFIALARARDIPTRLHFGSRLQEQNAGKPHDPGYRCWVTYFVPGYGWVPMDVSAGNTDPKQKDRYWHGLDERRVRFSEGRDLELSPRQTGERINLVIVAHVEVDGKPHTKFERVVQFDEIKKP